MSPEVSQKLQKLAEKGKKFRKPNFRAWTNGKNTSFKEVRVVGMMQRVSSRNKLCEQRWRWRGWNRVKGGACLSRWKVFTFEVVRSERLPAGVSYVSERLPASVSNVSGR